MDDAKITGDVTANRRGEENVRNQRPLPTISEDTCEHMCGCGGRGRSSDFGYSALFQLTRAVAAEHTDILTSESQPEV